MSEVVDVPVRLMDALRFDDNDLSANRDGRISEMQNYRLRVRRRQGMVLGVFLFIIIVLVATALIFFGRRNDSAILVFVGVGLTLCNAAMMGIFARYWLRLNTDIQTGKVNIVSGRLERVLKPVNRRIVNYLIRVDEVELFVKKETFMALEHEQLYTLYRTPHTGILLAIEPQLAT